MDDHGRPYYVDHNTRTTTWQRPNPDMMNHLQQFQQWRQNRPIDQFAGRFLYPQPGNAPEHPLGQLPDDWGGSKLLRNLKSIVRSSFLHGNLFLTEERMDHKTGRPYYVNHKSRTTQWEDPRTQGLDICDL